MKLLTYYATGREYGSAGVARGGVRKITKKDCKACKLKKKANFKEKLRCRVHMPNPLG